MTGIDDIPWGDDPSERIQTAAPKKCKHLGERVSKNISPDGVDPVWAESCHRCGHVFSAEKQKQGRSSNRIAKDIERWVARMLRLTRVGQYGGQEDVGKAGEWAFVQVKSGPSWFAERYYREVAALPRVAGARRALVVAEKPGSTGRPRRALWIEILDELPLPAESGVRWEQDDGGIKCVNCGAEFPEHQPYCVHAHG